MVCGGAFQGRAKGIHAIFGGRVARGIQAELSQPVVVLLNEGTETIAIASEAGFRCFTTAIEFQRYVQKEVLSEEASV